jgi:hypothetical protein
MTQPSATADLADMARRRLLLALLEVVGAGLSLARLSDVSPEEAAAIHHLADSARAFAYAAHNRLDRLQALAASRGNNA